MEMGKSYNSNCTSTIGAMPHSLGGIPRLSEKKLGLVPPRCQIPGGHELCFTDRQPGGAIMKGGRRLRARNHPPIFRERAIAP